MWGKAKLQESALLDLDNTTAIEVQELTLTGEGHPHLIREGQGCKDNSQDVIGTLEGSIMRIEVAMRDAKEHAYILEHEIE